MELRSPGHSKRASTLHNLGFDLRSRFLKFGATADLDEALSLHRSALGSLCTGVLSTWDLSATSFRLMMVLATRSKDLHCSSAWPLPQQQIFHLSELS